MKNVRGKRVLITGSAGGIGLCTARYFAESGAILIITDINEKALEEAAAELRASGTTVLCKTVNVSSQTQVNDLAAWVKEEVGGIDILINNAGMGYSGELEDTSSDTWKKLIDVNLMGALYHVHAFLPGMKEQGGGQIVNVSSGQAFFRMPTWGAYATSKVALGAVSEMLYFELRKHRIRVTTVYPFMVNTPFYNEIKSETLGGKISMKLVPYYSMTPQKVGKIIFKATLKERRVEMVSVFNDFAYYTRLIPPVSSAISWTTNLLLGKRPNENKHLKKCA
jgi:NAD(P)-dependent dehydrogenase (short-subunit alcohol dehydrogenase family)